MDQLHRRVPRLLSDPCTLTILVLDYRMDPSPRSVANVSWWIVGWTPIRQLRPPLHPAHRKLPARFRSDDGLDFNQVLPIPALARRLQRDRGIYGLLSVLQLHHDVVLQEKGALIRNSCKWELARWSYLPYHGSQVNSPSRLSVDHEDLRISDSGAVDRCQCAHSVAHSTVPEAGQDYGFRATCN
jgi:hypothetical protein